MVKSLSVPADVGICMRKIPDRSNLVVLSFLGARFSRTAARVAPGPDWCSDRCDLSHLRFRQRSRRMVAVVLDPAGSFPERRTQDRQAHLRGQHHSHRLCLSLASFVASRPPIAPPPPPPPSL